MDFKDYHDNMEKIKNIFLINLLIQPPTAFVHKWLF